MKVVTGENLTAEDIDRIIVEAFSAVFKKEAPRGRHTKGNDDLS